MLGKNIKELRTERGYTQARLAKEIGLRKARCILGKGNQRADRGESR